MQLRLPGGGGALDALLDVTSSNISQGPRSAITEGATPDEVRAAIDALGAGHVEYVGLDDDVASIQAAEMPGGYVLERLQGGGDDWVAYPESLTIDELREAFLSFLGGDVTAGIVWPEVPAPTASPKEKRGWFRRK